MAKSKSNYTIKGMKVIANVAELTENELAIVRNYIALGYTLKEKNTKQKTKSIADMREELKNDKETLEKFEAAYATKAPKGNKDFKETGFGKACMIYNAWAKEHKVKNK